MTYSPSFKAIHGREPEARVDYDPQETFCQDDYEFFKGEGGYIDSASLIYSEYETNQNYGEPMFWSNQLGWCNFTDADIFAPEDNDDMPLPDGKLVPYAKALDMSRKYYKWEDIFYA